MNNIWGTKRQRRELRKNKTPAEEILWTKLRRKQLGYKFRQQHSFGKYIMDFYCPSLLLAIEVDGSVHGKMSRQTHDEIRTKYLENNFITVIRCTNEQVLTDIGQVIISIQRACKQVEEKNHHLFNNIPLRPVGHLPLAGEEK